MSSYRSLQSGSLATDCTWRSFHTNDKNTHDEFRCSEHGTTEASMRRHVMRPAKLEPCFTNPNVRPCRRALIEEKPDKVAEVVSWNPGVRRG